MSVAQKFAELQSMLDDLCARAVAIDQKMREIEQSEFLTEREAATEFNIAVKTLQNWRSANPPRGPAYQKAGRKVLYHRRDVERWINHRPTASAASD